MTKLSLTVGRKEIKLLANLLNELSSDTLDDIGISDQDQKALKDLERTLWQFSRFMKLF